MDATIIFFFITVFIVIYFWWLLEDTVYLKKGKIIKLEGDYKLFYTIKKNIKRTTLTFEIEGKIIKNKKIIITGFTSFTKEIYKQYTNSHPLECYLEQEKSFCLEETTTKEEIEKEQKEFEENYKKTVEKLAKKKVTELIKEKKIIRNAKKRKL